MLLTRRVFLQSSLVASSTLALDSTPIPSLTTPGTVSRMYVAVSGA